VHRDAWNLEPHAELDAGQQMRIERVYAAVADQSHQMQRAAGSSQPRAELEKGGQPEEIALGDARGNAHDVLGDDAAGPQVEMPDFAIAHLSFRKSYGETAGVEQCAGERIPETVPHRRAPQLDGIALATLSISPAIQDDQGDRCGPGIARSAV